MLIKKIIIFLLCTSSIVAEANFLEQIRRNQNTRPSFSFNFFPGSLIHCTSLRDGDDLVIVYHNQSDYASYNVFERMYSSRKDCTLNQELLEELATDEPCFIEKLERLTDEAFDHAEIFEESLRNENPALLRGYKLKISFLVKDHRKNFFENLLSAMSRSNVDESCPWEMDTHIQIKVITPGEDERHERIFEDPTF